MQALNRKLGEVEICVSRVGEPLSQNISSEQVFMTKAFTIRRDLKGTPKRGNAKRNEFTIVERVHDKRHKFTRHKRIDLQERATATTSQRLLGKGYADSECVREWT